MFLAAVFLILLQVKTFSGGVVSQTDVDPQVTTQSAATQVVTLSATVTTGGGAPITAGEVSFQVKDFASNDVGTAVVDTTLTAAGVAEVSYTLPADIVGSFTIEASFTETVVVFGPSMGTNSLIVTADRVFVDAPADFTITNDVAPLGGTPTTGDTVTWTSPSLGTQTGAIFGGDAFDSIQDAVNAVSDNGLVFVADGTYTEGAEISISKSVRFFGDDMTNTILDGANTHRVINIGAGSFTVQFRDFTIQNGNADGSSDGGGGILTASTGTVTISDSVISGNSADSGGANLAGGGASV